MLEGLDFNLSVVPFLNICVPNLPQGQGQRLVGGCQSWVGGAILETGKGRPSQRRQWGQRLVRIHKVTNNIQTSKEYRIWLLFKRLYAAWLAWLSQGLGTKVLAWNKENMNRVRRLYAKDERIIVTWGQISMKQGCRNEGWNKGNRDKQRGVRDVMEIENKLEDGKGIVEKKWHGMDFVRDPSVIWYLTQYRILYYFV